MCRFVGKFYAGATQECISKHYTCLFQKNTFLWP